jgi:hypothetical protein
VRRQGLSNRRGTVTVWMLFRASPAPGLHRLLHRLAAVALVGALGTFTFADGVHSVHHLPDHKAASRCALAAASANVVSGVADLIPVALPPLPRLVAFEKCAPTAPSCRPVWAKQGRAPPVSPS